MKNIVIAAGYATRLYPLTQNFPKPLLKVGNRTILDRMLDDLDNIQDIDSHIIVSNHKFASIFQEWAKKRMEEGENRKPITIIDDGTSTNDTRLGAVRDLLLAIDTIENAQDSTTNGQSSMVNGQWSTVNGQYSMDNGQRSMVNIQWSTVNGQRSTVNIQWPDDIMVVAADNILDFSFQGFVDYFKQKESSVIMCHHEPELRKLQRTGVIAVDEQMKVLEMQEKPEKPVSNWAVPPFYIYKKEDLPLIRDCMNHGCGFDAPGNLAHYLVDVTTIHAWPMSGSRYDIGSLDSYEEAQRIFADK